MSLRTGLCLLALLALSACGGQVQKSQKTGHPVQTASVAPDQERARARSAPRERRVMTDSAAPTKPVFTSEERDPSRLLALGRGDLSSILGRPSFVRKDMSAEVWQYRTEVCVLDLFLYETERQVAVTYYEFRARRSIALARDECFVNLLRQGVASATPGS